MSENGDRYGGRTPGEVIRIRREERGLTQRELAELVGQIDAAGVSKIETGVTRLGRARATRFARALAVPVSLLLPPVESQPTLREVVDRLESLRGAVQLLTSNQELLVALVEKLAEPGQQAGGRES